MDTMQMQLKSTFQNMQTKFNFRSLKKKTYQTLELWATNTFTYMLEAKCVY